MTRLTVQDVLDLVTQARLTTLTLQSIGQHLTPSLENVTLHATIEAADLPSRLARLDEVDRFLADVVGGSHMGGALDDVILSSEEEESVCPDCGGVTARTVMSVGDVDGCRDAEVWACSSCEYVQEVGR